ncbi:hypothetical protein FD12_GL001251 [Lentilactobacillus rapi DSM 19907 = JCM 15042]|uniref:MucBP domain protein n=4 Tax=Lentilactobacillus rapi TaxID=481723 RepID=A0ABR5P9V0_9LACO|nr:hypothetical protein FD12_GL001251 [Lentilactobacillus rapi DSM 19907 = JCM 15042]
MVAIAAVLFLLSFNLMGGQQSALAATYTANAYMDASGNWLGGTSEQRDTWLQTVVNPAWKGETNAEGIPGDATGKIDEWMPDKDLQQIVLYEFIKTHTLPSGSSVNDITKNMMSKIGTRFIYDTDEQQNTNNPTYFNQVHGVRSSEGLQYDTSLTTVNLSSSTDANAAQKGTPFVYGALSDITSLASLPLTDINVSMNRLHDISALKGKALSDLDVSYNNITDLSPLFDSTSHVDPRTEVGFQYYMMPTAHLNPKTTEYTTPSFIIKDANGANVPVHPFIGNDSLDNFNTYFGNYISTATGNGGSTSFVPSIKWTNLRSPNGFMTSSWEVPFLDNDNYTYNGVVIQPYVLDDTVGNVIVNFKDGDTGQILRTLFLSGALNTSWKLSLSGVNSFKLADQSGQNSDIQAIIDALKENYGFNKISVSDPSTGTYADTTTPTVTYTFNKTEAAAPVTVKYVDADSGNSIATDKTFPATGTANVGDSYNVSTSDYKININGYTFKDVKAGSDPVTGTFDGTAKTVTYEYTKTVGKLVTVNYIDAATGESIAPSKQFPATGEGHVGDAYDVSTPAYKIDIDGYTYQSLMPGSDSPTGTLSDRGQTVTYQYQRNAEVRPVIVKYVDAATGNSIAPDKSFPVTGKKIGDGYDVSTPTYRIEINGYTYKGVKAGSDSPVGTLSDRAQTITYEYTKNSNPTPPNPGPGPKPEPTPQPTPTPSTPTVTTQPSTPGIAKKGEAVYALKKIYIYSNKDFKQSERVASYAKKPRINRPMFVVTDYAKSKAGNLRYVVRDVNHHSKTAGKKGYITADYAYVRPVYYHSSHKTLTVINPRGVNEYKNKNLTGKVKNFKQGTQLKVKGFVKHNLTTRYLLSNGHYITGNRKLVIAGNQKQPKQIKVKKAIYRYNNANFGKHNKLIKKGTVLKVKKWEYSHPYSTTTFGAKRYAVAGGYVTANSKYVKIIK